jgi:rod shape-determining protein MreC
MVFDRQESYFSKFRSRMMAAVYPLQAVVDKPMHFFHWIENTVSAQQEVLAENGKLRARQLMLQAKLQRLLAIERENLHLRELLNSSTHLTGKVIVAQLVSVDLNPLTREVTLDKGYQDDVSEGQPVLDATGIFGQVIEVGPFSSRVLLTNDGRSAIPVQNNRNGLRSIAAGTSFADRLILLNMPATVDIEVGDVFVTSGLGGKFPFGYPVGRVVSIERKQSGRFAEIQLEPSANLNSSRLVMLIWPSGE